MPISSTYKQTGHISSQPWNTTKSRRLSTTLPPLDSNKSDDSGRKRPRSATGNRSNNANSSKEFHAKPAWVAGSFEKPLSEKQNASLTSKTASRKTLKRRETLPEFGENSFTPLPKFKRSNSDSLLEPCESGSKRKVRRATATMSKSVRKYRKRFSEKSASSRIRPKKVEPESKLTVNNSKICFNKSNQTPNSLGQRVLCVLNKQIKSGVVQYLGATHFSTGQWCGIVLDEPCGKNDGCVKGVRYFTCAENYGIFVHPHKVKITNRPNHQTNGLEFRESDENLATRTGPKDTHYNNRTSMDCTKVERFGVNNSSDDKLTKKRSKSLSDGTAFQTNISKSTDNDCNDQATWSELTRSSSLPRIPDQVCNNDDYIGNDSEFNCNYQLQSNSSNDCNGMDDNSDFSEKQEDSSSDNSHKEPYPEEKVLKCGDLFTTTSNILNDGTNMMTEKRSYSSDYITSINLKTKHDLNSPGPHAALERNSTIDAFVQDKYCSCPNLVPSQHLSSALEACIDLGRQELESHSEKNSPIKEEQSVLFTELNEESELDDVIDRNEPEQNSYKLPHYGRSKSLPLVLVQIRDISETESLFWSTDKLAGLVLNEERSASWPVLSTSACRLDLRPDNKITETDVVNTDQAKDTQDTLSCETETVVDGGEQEKSKTFSLKKQSAVENLAQSDNESLSQSGSQVSLSSVETNASKKARKVSASSASSTKSQSRRLPSKSQKTSKVNQRKESKDAANRTGKLAPAPGRLVKRHTVSSLQYQPATTPGTTRPSMNKRPTSTISQPVNNTSAVSPSCGKSKLPTMKKTPTAASDKPLTSKPPIKKAAVRPTSIELQGVKKVPGPPSKKTPAGKPSAASTTSTQRKASTFASSKKTSIKTESTVQKRTKIGSKPGQQAALGTDRKVSTTKTTVANKPKATKPLTPQDNTGSPASKPASSPAKPYHSRLPTRKITSRDASIESSQSHECDVDTVSIGTDGSDFIDGHRLSRGELESIPNDHYDADRSDLESSTKSWQYASHAPDILTGTREIHTRSVEVQVELVDEQDDIRHKYVALERSLHTMKKYNNNLEIAVADRDNNLISCAILVAALCKKLQGNGRFIMHLKKELHMTESELKQVQERLAEEEANAVKVQEEMMYVRSEHTVAIQNLKADHEDTLEALRYSMKKQLAEEQAKANEERVKELLELNKVHAEKEVEIKKLNEKALAEEREKYKDEIVEIETKHSQHIDELLEEHQVEIETIKADYDEQQGGFESKLFAVTNECAALNMKLLQLQEDTERDIESRIQEAIEKYKALPAELESMKAVLDMRNEENKQLKKERMEAQMEVDHLRKVAERVKRLEHDNESLSFVVQNKSKVERQLSVEHEHLKTSLDKESKKLKRLSLENEELQWKLYNTSSSPTEECASPVFTVNNSPPTSKRRSFRLSSDVDTIRE